MRDPQVIFSQVRQGSVPSTWRLFSKKRGTVSAFFSGTLNDPNPLLADFGIARFTTATSTTSQSIRGTPACMAPEQWDGQPTAASDQYALAVLVYQLLTGRLLFQGGPGQV